VTTPCTGRCHCGSIAYEASPPFGTTSHCHCEDCRRSHSAAFVTWTSASRANFRFARGGELLSLHESHPGVRWGFCSRCGTSFYYETSEEPEVAYFTLASLDDEKAAPRPTCHYSFEERADWMASVDSLPSYRGKTHDPSSG
jgi:hypothetical protein